MGVVRKTLSRITPLRNLVHSYRRVNRAKEVMNVEKSNAYFNGNVEEMHQVTNTMEHNHNKPYDVGIVGLWYGLNYGSVLTYYALYELVQQLGYSAVMLQKPPQIWRPLYNDPDTIAQTFVRDRCNVGPLHEKKEELIEDNNLANTFVLGSDVVWNYNICGREGGHYFFLDFVDGLNKKIAFASSLGDGMEDAPDEYKNVASVYLRDFDGLSVREMQAKDILKEKYGAEATHVMDPVFLVKQSTYDDITDTVEPLADEPYIMSYVLGMDDEKRKTLKRIEDNLGKKLIPFGNPNAAPGRYDGFDYDIMERDGIPDWLRGMKDCDFFFGDSFHGLCYALIFHRPFVIYINKNCSGIQRFESLMKLTGLEDRLIYTHDKERYDKIDKLLETEIDWDDVEARLAPMKTESEQWLDNALKSKKKSFWKKHKD